MKSWLVELTQAPSPVVHESELTLTERRRVRADLRTGEFDEYLRRLRGIAALERDLAAS